MQGHETVIADFQLWREAPMALATVISTWSSAPRTHGSHMIVVAEGRFEGFVSGGCVDGDVFALAGYVIRTGLSERRQYGMSDASAWEAGLPFGAASKFWCNLLLTRDLRRRSSTKWSAGGRSVRIATDPVTGKSVLTTAVFKADAFLNRYGPPRRLFTVRAAQIAQSLAGIARTLGIRPVVIDPCGRFLTEGRFPNTDLDDRWPDEAIAAWKPDAASAVVTLNHDQRSMAAL